MDQDWQRGKGVTDQGEPARRPQIVVIGVNYHTDDMTVRFVRALAAVSAGRAATVVVVDNSERLDGNALFARLRGLDPRVMCVKAQRNLGYFGGAHLGLGAYQRLHGEPDWVVVSNVDVEFRDGAFWDHLAALDGGRDLGVVAPSIWSNHMRCDLNPMMERRPPRQRIQFYKVLFKNYYALNCYELLARAKSVARNALRALRGSDGRRRAIYAAQGSCIVFSRSYFDRGGKLAYPSFLFGEELFVAETARHLQLQVIYEPRLRVWHDDHASTGVLRSRKIARFVSQSATYIADAYFP